MKYFVTNFSLLLFLFVTAVAYGEAAVPTAICTSISSGNWNTTSIWSCNHAPTNGDDVFIIAGHVVTLNANRTSRSLSVAGTLLFGDSTTNRSLTITGTVSIGNGGLITAGPFNGIHTLTVRGDFVNDGVLDGLPGAGRVVNVTFNGAADQIIAGTGVYTFNNLTVNNTTATSIIDAESVITLAGTTNPLILTSGIFKLSSNSTILPFTSNRTLGVNAGLWIANGTVNGGNLNITLNGMLRVTGGTLNIGTNSNNSLLNGATGRVFIEGGTINLAGRFARSGATSSGTFSMTNGRLNVVTVGSTSTTVPGIDISGASSSWTMSGGTVVLRRRTSHTTYDVLIAPNAANLSGGTLQIGDSATPAGQTLRINATTLSSLLIDGTTTAKTAQLVTTSPALRGHLMVSSTSTLNANNLNLSLTGNWINDGTFSAGNGTVTFNHVGTQGIAGNTATAFNNVVVENGSTTIIPSNNSPTVVGAFTVNAGGTVQQTSVVNNGTVSFLQISTNRYRGVDLTSLNDLGTVTVTIETVAPGGCTDDSTASPAYATRCYRIDPTNDNAATVRLWALTSQLNTTLETNLKVFHWDGAAWQKLSTNASNGNDGGIYSYAQADTPGFSEFLLGGTTAPTAMTLSHLTAGPAPINWALPIIAFSLLLSSGAVLKRSRQRLRRHHTMKHLVISLFCLGLILGQPANRSANATTASTCTSAASGNWTAITWSGCAVGPQSGDVVVIAPGHTVNLDTSVIISDLTVNGTLTFGNDTTSRTLTVTGNVTINTGGRIDTSNAKAGHAINVGRDLNNNGTFDGYQNKNRYIDITFNGVAPQLIGGNSAVAISNLTINSGARVVFPADNLPEVKGVMTVNPGGAVQQTQTVNTGTVNFLQISNDAYRGIDLTTPNNLGSTTVVITTTAGDSCTTSGASSPPYATRCYEITPANNLTATIRLYALTDTQLNGITQANLRIHLYSAGTWQPLTTNAATGTASGGYSYAQADTPRFSDFLLSGSTHPTAVTLSTLSAQAPEGSPLLLIGLALLAGALVLVVRHRL